MVEQVNMILEELPSPVLSNSKEKQENMGGIVFAIEKLIYLSL